MSAGAPTPEEIADLPDRVIKALLDNQTRVRTLFRRWLIVASLVLGFGVGYVAWNSHQQGRTIDQVRTSQLANTKTTNHRDQCSQTAYHDLAYDLKVLVTPGETPKEFLGQVKIPGDEVLGITAGDIGIWFGIVVAAASGVIVIMSRKGATDDEEALRTATLMTAQVTALDSKVQLLESDLRNKQTEIQHLHELRAEDAKTIERNASDLGRLTELVTQQAAVAQFRTESFAWFEAIAAAVNATPPTFPDHVPA